ncbi:cysteine-rich repeat secretory protein 3-like, partial [Morus notabilis]|uniref:cysteine-rich repeat secretory protein 3-like n=1 Tax=Morus notabilis TaxID=981085 RepID=UPI000CED77CA
YKASSGVSSTTATSFTGLFQCRGDLSPSACASCVSKLPSMTDSLCGNSVAAARVQLLGCYLSYEVAGFAQISGMELLYKACGSTNVEGAGFEERRDTAFSVMENGVVSG